MIFTMSSENVLVWYSGERPGRWESLESSLEVCPCLHEDNRSPEIQGMSGRKGGGDCVVTRRPGRGLRRWEFRYVLGEQFPFSIPCPMQKAHATQPLLKLRGHPENRISMILSPKKEQKMKLGFGVNAVLRATGMPDSRGACESTSCLGALYGM